VKGKVQGPVFRFQSELGYASETWAMKVKNMARLERTERMIIRVRWMCGVDLKSKTASAELNSQLCIECIAKVLS